MPEVELSAGTIEYEDTGGDGPVIVFLHGATIDSSVWRHVIAVCEPTTGASPRRCRWAPTVDPCARTPICPCWGRPCW